MTRIAATVVLCFLALHQFSIVNSAFLSLSIPIKPPGGLITTVANYSDGISNALCEKFNTHLLCGTSVAVGHAILQQLPAVATIRHCSVFLASPHCCAQFCRPGEGGNCDLDTGACFCKPRGVPKVCELILPSESSPASILSSNDNEVLAICKEKCASNPNGCTKAAAATDGIVGTVCMCYCDP